MHLIDLLKGLLLLIGEMFFVLQSDIPGTFELMLHSNFPPAYIINCFVHMLDYMELINDHLCLRILRMHR